MIATTKDFRKEKFFTENRLTTIEEMKALAIHLLAKTWTIDVYRFSDSSVINLSDRRWRFEFSSARRQAGLCDFGSKTIFISKWLLEQNLDKPMFFEDTIRHEIAHALDFEIRGTSDHGNVWKLIARQVLCNAERCYKVGDISITKKTKYTLICDNCGVERPSHKKKTRKTACGKCCNTYNGGKYTEKFAFRQVQNY